MLVLTRNQGEKIVIGEDVVIAVLDVRANSVRIGIDAPESVPINRMEVHKRVQRENELAAEKDPPEDQPVDWSKKTCLAKSTHCGGELSKVTYGVKKLEGVVCDCHLADLDVLYEGDVISEPLHAESGGE